MSLWKLSAVVDNWVECRKRTITSLRDSARELNSSHHRNARAAHENASASLVADFIGLGGLLLAPFSGGASLAICGFSSLAGIGSYLEQRDADKKDNTITRQVERDVEQAIREDRSATDRLNDILFSFTQLESQLKTMRIGDIIIRLEESSVTSLNISVSEIENIPLSYPLQNNDLIVSGTAVSSATKGADITIKTVKNIKQASNTVKTVTRVATNTDKAIRTTRITTNAAKVTKASQTVTKAAPISKFGLAINAVVIPLDIYNLVVASNNLEKSHEDVKRIMTVANDLEEELENIKTEIKVQVESFKELHLQLFNVYENHRSELIYEYLELMHEKLEFSLPRRY